MADAPADDALMTDDAAIKASIHTFGPVATMHALIAVTERQNGNCHDRAHKVGRFSFEEFGPEVFKLNLPECHSGFYHGATEAFFKKNGTASLKEDLSTICPEALNGFFTHQCFHGIGHGLMAWSNYDLPASLDYCNLLPSPSSQSSCRTGVFMENIVGSLTDRTQDTSGHFTKYLSDDPQFPCTIVNDAYKYDCYFLQTDRMFALSKTGFAGVAAECEKASQVYQNSCYSSMGRTIDGMYRGQNQHVIDSCLFANDHEDRVACLTGAVQDTFWDTNGQEIALAFCPLVREEDGRKECYATIIGRSHDILTTEQQKAFCGKLPADEQHICFSSITS